VLQYCCVRYCKRSSLFPSAQKTQTRGVKSHRGRLSRLVRTYDVQKPTHLEWCLRVPVCVCAFVCASVVRVRVHVHVCVRVQERVRVCVRVRGRACVFLFSCWSASFLSFRVYRSPSNKVLQSESKPKKKRPHSFMLTSFQKPTYVYSLFVGRRWDFQICEFVSSFVVVCAFIRFCFPFVI